MRIAFIVTLFPRLSETFILNQITGLIDRGHEVDIFALQPGDELIVHDDITHYQLLNLTTYPHEIPENKLLRLKMAVGLFFKNFHKNPRAVLNLLNVYKYGKNAASLRLFFRIIPFVNKNHYDILHCHFGPNGNFGILLKEIGAVTGKVVTTFHGFDLTSYIRERGESIYKKLFNKGDLFIPISNHWKKKLIELGCPSEKIIVHKMGINIQRFPFSRDKLCNNRRARILTVGRLVEKKGIKYGIQAVAEVLKTFPEITYLIAGDGPLRKELFELIERLNISNNVKLIGWKEQSEIAELMNQAEIFLAPSITSDHGDQEGIPVVLMEAMARGLPVISTFHSGIPELIFDGKTGLLVNERDAKALSQKIEQLIALPELQAMLLKREGRKFVEKNHDINRLNSKLVGVFERLLSL